MTVAITPTARTSVRPNPARLGRGSRVGAGVIAALGCGVLAARPALLGFTARPSVALALLFGALMIVGLMVPVPRCVPPDARPRATFALATAIGVLAFSCGRVVIGGHAPTALTLSTLALNTFAALAEEVWFRRLCYGLLAPVGPGFAIAATSMLFAAVHVSTYGFAVLPLDLAAGALFGWQRAATGSWSAPAVTHVLANLFVLL